MKGDVLFFPRAYPSFVSIESSEISRTASEASSFNSIPFMLKRTRNSSSSSAEAPSWHSETGKTAKCVFCAPSIRLASLAQPERRSGRRDSALGNHNRGNRHRPSRSERSLESNANTEAPMRESLRGRRAIIVRIADDRIWRDRAGLGNRASIGKVRLSSKMARLPARPR